MIPAWQNRLEKRSTKMNTSRRLLSLAFILVPALLSPIVRTTGADQRVTIPIITAPAAFVGPNINASRLTGNHHENSIAINPANPAQVVVVSNTENSPGMLKAYSTDSGATWTSGSIANGDAPAAFVGPNINASRLTGNHHENSIAINPANPAQVVVVSNTENSPGMMRAYSTDSGATWTSGIIANGDALGNGCGDPSLAWDNFGNLFLTYLDCTITDVQLGLSTDGGQTFSFVTTVARPT